jgi:hypothetical protein
MIMVDRGPQRPGESDRAYMTRMGQVAREDAARRRADARESEEAGRREAQQMRRQDEKWESEITDALFGLTPDEVLKNIADKNADYTQPERRAINEVAKQSRKGNRRRARRVARSGPARSAAKKAKKNRSWFNCSVLAVLLLGALGGAGYGLVAAGTAIVSAMAR